jgi:hypothetical protein
VAAVDELHPRFRNNHEFCLSNSKYPDIASKALFLAFFEVLRSGNVLRRHLNDKIRHKK